MENWSALLALTVAISLDGLAAGFSYGLKGMQLTRLPLAIVAGASGMLLAVFLLIGKEVGGIISPQAGKLMGALLLILLGAVGLWQTFARRIDEKHKLSPGDPPTALWQVRLEKLGLVIQVLRDPNRADIDGSGNISEYEALILGLALGLDAAGVGFGLGLTGLTGIWLPLLVAAANLGFITLGQMAGVLSRNRGDYPKFMEYCPGLILIFIGLVMAV